MARIKVANKKYYRTLDVPHPTNEWGELMHDGLWEKAGRVFEFQKEKDGIGYFTNGIYGGIPLKMSDMEEIPESEVEIVPYSLADLAEFFKTGRQI